MSGACPRCGGPVGCVECHPQTMRIRAEGRRLKKKVEELERQGPPGDASEDLSSLEALKKENQELKSKLEAMEKRWRSASIEADKLRETTKRAYMEVISAAKAAKMNCVFQLGVTVDEFLKEWFP